MPEYLAPGVYIEETPTGPRPIEGVGTSSAALLGEAGRGPSRPRLVTSYDQYRRAFGRHGPFLPDAVRGFFANGGKRAFVGRLRGPGALARALAALEADAFREVALVGAPGLVSTESVAAIVAHCESHRRFAVIDAPRGNLAPFDPRSVRASANAAVYAPWLAVKRAPGAARRLAPPSGHVLGIYARTDIHRGVWKAPANESVRDALGLEQAIDEAANGKLAERGINAIRAFPGRGMLVWGARTLSTDPEWKYVNVRRLLIYLERSIDKGTHWVVFEPNGERLWAAVRGQVENFLHALWRNGAFPGDRPEASFFVRCDRTTMTQADIDSGRLILEVGMAPVRPAEFVIFRIGQWTCESCS